MFAWKFHFYGSSVELRNSFVEDTSTLDKKNNKLALTTIHGIIYTYIHITESYSSQIPHLILGHVDIFMLLGSNISYVYGTDFLDSFTDETCLRPYYTSFLSIDVKFHIQSYYCLGFWMAVCLWFGQHLSLFWEILNCLPPRAVNLMTQRFNMLRIIN